MTTHALPESPMGQRLWEIFGRYPWSFLQLRDGDRDWMTVNNYPLKPRVLWKRWQDAATQIGVRFGSSTQYAVIDIDKGSPHLNSIAIAGIKEALETIGIVRVINMRSSWSGGLHLYCPLPEAVNTFNLAIALKGCLSAHGFDLKDGHLETMPNVKAYGRSWVKEFVEYQGHRLPLQPGSGSMLLNDQFQPVSDKLERLFWTWEFASTQQDTELLAMALAAAKNNRRKHKTVHTPFAEWRDDLRDELSQGWTDYGQTNALLKSIATYGRVFLKLEGTALAEHVEDTARSLPGFDRWCRHTHEIARKSWCWARSVEKYYYPAGSTAASEGDGKAIEDKPNGNKERSWDAARRIVNAVTQLWLDDREDLTKPTDLAAAIVKFARCSLKTLYRHRELWHPDTVEAQLGEGKTCKTAHVATLLDCYRPPDTPSIPNSAITPQPLINGFLTHPGGGMKSPYPENRHKKNLSSGMVRGFGGKEGLSTTGEGV